MNPIRHLCTFAICASFSAVVQSSSTKTEDLFVVGKVKTIDLRVMDELGLNCDISAHLTISRVIKGKAPSHVINVRYIAHSELSDARKIRFHLRRSDGDTWLVCSDGKGRGYVC